MSKGLRFSEKWFRRGLWLIALVFAGFLIGLGGLIVADLPKVETALTLERFLDPQADAVKARLKAIDAEARPLAERREQAAGALERARAEVRAAQASLQNWLATRSATQRSEQDPEVIQRTQGLDALKAKEREAERALEALDTRATELRQERARLSATLQELERKAAERLTSETRAQELRVFLYRLALTLPLIALALWLFRKHRQSRYWPFVWGFILFALFTFFVELVPYLPSYGGYVHYGVGILLTLVIGHYAIRAMQRYLEQQKAVEAQPETARREQLDYDLAMNRLAKKICPGCERPADLANPEINHCIHCGIALFDHCAACRARKNAFARYCHACGAPSARHAEAGEASA
ncbi:MAG: serine endopeptidase [Casimicrobiaceae bacterium]|nr:serine endopeptidase [Casimicrobiaceae bacterium]